MRFLRVCISLCVVLAAAVGAASAALARTPPRSQLTRFSCQRALDPGNRSVGVRAVMRPRTGTRRMAIRFDLLQRVGSAPATVVRGGDLGVWVSPSNPTLGRVRGDVWRLDKSVIDLPAPATYQFRVTFRWIGTRGRVLGSTTRSTHRCRQPELRPDVAITSFTVSPVAGHPRQDRYTAVVTNRGRTASGPFQVLFVRGGGAPQTTDNLASLRAGRSRTLSFIGPLCNPAGPPTVTADSAQQVDDYNRANNSATAVCPPSG